MRYGILSYGAYVPSFRLARSIIADAVSWAVPGVKGLAKGERAVANWDEDSITLAVEAGRNCLAGFTQRLDHLQLASTTLPFADRSNSGVVGDALLCPAELTTEDLGGSRRAGSSALVRLGLSASARTTLLLAADCRETKPGSTQEMNYGHGAAGFVFGTGEPIAVVKGAASIHEDLIDQYRATDSDYDYALEERWIREEGYNKLVPRAVHAAAKNAGIELSEIHRFVMPAAAAIAKGVAKILKVDAALFADPLTAQVGDCGAAHPLLMLAQALETAVPGEKILVIGFGQGADAIILETTARLADLQPTHGPGRYLKARRVLDNYTKFLALRNQLDLDFGLRAERDNRTAQSVFYRRRKDITGMVGGRCKSCNTLQYPRAQLCVKCGEIDTQAGESLSGLLGRVKSYTEDWLAYTPLPPYIYGNVEFADGANCMLEFTDFEPGQVKIGNAVRMVFRIKDFDGRRHFRRYFWKPAPIPTAAD
ncbi:MAG: OB-fold domain-containing protein [Gammaproteobacteria bacterium]|nr:OB-fold domain-containing protein [Gammaproteobacteria bacterium]